MMDVVYCLRIRLRPNMLEHIFEYFHCSRTICISLAILAYKHVLEHSIQNYGHFSGFAKSRTWERFPHIWSGPTADKRRFKD